MNIAAFGTTELTASLNPTAYHLFVPMLFAQQIAAGADWLRIASNVGTPIGLLGLIACLSFFAWSAYLKNQEERLKQLPEGERAKAVDVLLTRYQVDGTGLSPIHRFQLIQRELEDRARARRLYAILSAAVFVACFAIAAVAYATTSANKNVVAPVLPPDQFISQQFRGFTDPRLPTSVFGSLMDEEGRPRGWMENAEAGASSQLELDPTKVTYLWILSDPFVGPHPKFLAYVNVGTSVNAIVTLYHVHRNATISFQPLTQRGPQGPHAEYLFDVPPSRKGDQLLAFVGLATSDYAAISGSRSITIRSQPSTF